jgi:membrane-associated protease RseP (regulator of RpoE activity)
MEFIGIVAFVVALLFSVMVHEFGHYITARKFGMKVTEFFLGFGKRIWSTQRGETEFGIKAIPAGGYCRISGMTPRDEMDLGEEDRAFIKASSGRKLIVLGAGSFLHFVLGFLILLVLFIGIGTNRITPQVSQVSDCIPVSTEACTISSAPSPAKAAGIKPGDYIMAINNKPVENWVDDVQIIRDSAGKELTLSIYRDGEKITIQATPVTRVVNGEVRGVLGIINEVANVRSDPIKATKDSITLSKEFLVSSVKSLVSLPAKIPALWGQTFQGEERDIDGLVGIVGVAAVSGQVTASDQMNWAERVGAFLLIVASLNFFVGVFNLLPILPLDGGHMAVAIADEIRAFLARLRGKPRPAPIDVTVLTPVTMVVFVLLAVLTVMLLVADIINPVNLNL